MYFKKIMFLSMGLLLFLHALPAQQIIKIKGKEAYLYDDGSWEYVVKNSEDRSDYKERSSHEKSFQNTVTNDDRCKRLIKSNPSLSNKNLNFETIPIPVGTLFANWTLNNANTLNIQISLSGNQCVRKSDTEYFIVGEYDQELYFKNTSESNCKGLITIKPSNENLKRLLSAPLNAVRLKVSGEKITVKFTENQAREFMEGGNCLKSLSQTSPK